VALDASHFFSGGACRRDGAGHIYPEELIAGDNITVMPTFRAWAQLAEKAAKDNSAGSQGIGQTYCFSQTELQLESSLLTGDITVPKDLRFGSAIPQLWVSVGRGSSGLHYDQWWNTIFLLQGSKRVLLFPPNASKYLYTVFPHDNIDLDDRAQKLQDFLQESSNEEKRYSSDEL